MHICMGLTNHMNDLQFYVLLANISVISGRWAGDYKRLCALEPHLQLKKNPPQVSLELGTVSLVGQCFCGCVHYSPF